MENKTVQVYSEKLDKMVSVDVIEKDDEGRFDATCVMLVVDEEEE